ncbi:cyclase family protein [Thermogymnomonas acidicola]|uniref:cyclase family protein n=1 Tax=Thermogymnomonas acidicola TaxID=399579 RepID=UPI0009462A45|nr:cyclase family protein [Thermogymnomonas acidicola]
MVDVASALGVDILEKGHAITVDEAKRFLRDHSLSIEAGDAVFFHTGISRLWENPPSEYNTYYESSPGVGYELAKYLASLHVSVVGADVPSTEVEPAEIEGGARLPVHQYLIAKSGIRMIDNMKLDEVSRDRVYEFLFLCSPPAIRGWHSLTGCARCGLMII